MEIKKLTIFLNYSGVMKSDESSKLFYNASLFNPTVSAIDPFALGYLKALINLTKAKIVLMPPVTDEALENLVRVIQYPVFDTISLMDHTGIVYHYEDNDNSMMIEKYIDKITSMKKAIGEDVEECYIIIDYSPQFYAKDQKNLIICNPATGFREKQFKEALVLCNNMGLISPLEH